MYYVVYYVTDGSASELLGHSYCEGWPHFLPKFDFTNVYLAKTTQIPRYLVQSQLGWNQGNFWKRISLWLCLESSNCFLSVNKIYMASLYNLNDYTTTLLLLLLSKKLVVGIEFDVRNELYKTCLKPFLCVLVKIQIKCWTTDGITT